MVELNEDKNNLVRVVSHDLRTPVNQISGFANLIKLEGNYLKNDHAELIDKIVDTSTRVINMATKILDVEALEDNKVNISLEPVNVDELIIEVVKGFEGRAIEKQIRIITKFNAVTDSVQADKTYLTQALANLISNALKFSESNTSINLETINREQEIEVRVNDQGPGISKEDMSKLFQKFQKLSARPTDGEQSIGLGLSIAKKFVDAMEGTITCESELGKGTAFIIRLKNA